MGKRTPNSSKISAKVYSVHTTYLDRYPCLSTSIPWRNSPSQKQRRHTPSMDSMGRGTAPFDISVSDERVKQCRASSVVALGTGRHKHKHKHTNTSRKTREGGVLFIHYISVILLASLPPPFPPRFSPSHRAFVRSQNPPPNNGRTVINKSPHLSLFVVCCLFAVCRLLLFACLRRVILLGN